MNSENHIVSIYVTSLSIVARNRCMLLYKSNDDGQILEKPKYIIMKTDSDDKIASSKESVIKESCLMRDDSVYTVLDNNEIFTLLYDLCTI